MRSILDKVFCFLVSFGKRKKVILQKCQEIQEKMRYVHLHRQSVQKLQNYFTIRLYILADYQGNGIAAAICNKLKQAVDMDKITTHASIMARTFFEKRGYKMIREQQIVRDVISLTNYLMKYKR